MKKILLIFVAGLLFYLHCCAQKKGKFLVDSLLVALSGMKEDTTKVNRYFDIMSAYVYSKPEEGLVYQAAALELAKKTGWKIGVAKIKDRIGRLHWRMGNFSEALKFHFEALEVFQHTEDRFSRYILVEIAQDYVDDGNYTEAEPYLLKSVKLSTAAGDKQTLGNAYDILQYLYMAEGNLTEATKIGYAFLKVNEEIGNKRNIYIAATQLGQLLKAIVNYPDALKYFKKAVQTIQGSGNKLTESYSNISLADLYQLTGNFPEATNYYKDGLRLANESKDANLQADVHAGMGNLYAAQGQYMEAITHYTRAEAGYKSVAHKQDLAALYSQMGKVYTHLKKYTQATKSFKDAMALYKSLGANLSMADYYNGMALLDSATGNWKDAYQHYRKYIVISDSSFSKETLKKAVASQMKYESDKNEANIKAEQEKKDVVTLAKIKRQRNILYSSFAVLAIVLVFWLVVFRQRNKIAKEKKRSDRLLMDKELLLKEIHHRVKNNLEVVCSLLALQSAKIDDPEIQDAMLASQNRVQSMGILHQRLYQSEHLAFIEMKNYFQNLAENILDSYNESGRIKVDINMDEMDLDIDTAVPVGLIVNELMTNSLKYAFPNGEKGTIKVSLENIDDENLCLAISDNGIGKILHIQPKGTSFGTQLVDLLTRQIEGTLTQQIKDGTLISIDFKRAKASQTA